MINSTMAIFACVFDLLGKFRGNFVSHEIDE